MINLEYWHTTSLQNFHVLFDKFYINQLVHTVILVISQALSSPGSSRFII